MYVLFDGLIEACETRQWFFSRIHVIAPFLFALDFLGASKGKITKELTTMVGN
jgi:hypothetical protein